MRLIASSIALDLIVALTQRRDGARLAELAMAVRAPLSATQSAMRMLLADAVVERDPSRRPRYRLRDAHPASRILVELAARVAPARRALDVVLRANPAVEFAARDSRGYVVVETPLADPRDVLLLEEALQRVADQSAIIRYRHQQLVDALRDDPAPRHRAARMTVLRGALARSFPGDARHGPRRRLAPISRRAIAGIARAHGLRRIRLFGSAARGALREGSDVDVLVEPRQGRRLSLLDLERIEKELEGIFARHVDVLTPAGLREDVRQAAEREATALYG